MVDTTLQSFSKQIDAELVEPLRRVLVGRKLVPVTPPAGFGVSAVEWSKVTEMSAGMVSYAFTANEDTFHATPTTEKIPVYWKDYTVDRRLYEGYKVKGVDPDSSAALSAAYVAAKVEDEAIILGVSNDGTNYDVDGLYSGAGNTFPGATFATPGNPTLAIAGAYDKLAEDDMPVGDGTPYNFVLARSQYMELVGLRSANGVREMPEIKEMLSGGEVIMSNTMGDGTGMMLPSADMLKPYVDFYLTTDWQTEHGADSEHPNTGDINGRVFSAGILRIKHDVAICTVTGI